MMDVVPARVTGDGTPKHFQAFPTIIAQPTAKQLREKPDIAIGRRYRRLCDDGTYVDGTIRKFDGKYWIGTHD